MERDATAEPCTIARVSTVHLFGKRVVLLIRHRKRRMRFLRNLHHKHTWEWVSLGELGQSALEPRAMLINSITRHHCDGVYIILKLKDMHRICTIVLRSFVQ